MLETGEPREVHHFALLIGYGAGAINPYLAFETLDDMIRQGHVDQGRTHEEARSRTTSRPSIKGVLKVMSKMGISTVQSYRGAQIFEAIGLNTAVIDKYFTWTALAHRRHRPRRHRRGGPAPPRPRLPERPTERHDARRRRPVPVAHATASTTCSTREIGPQAAARLPRPDSYKIFKEYCQLINDQSQHLCTLRGLLEFKLEADTPVPLEEVEPVEAIVKRFKTGAMSYGSISKEAHETLAIAMNRIGGKSNTGEGGEDPGPLSLPNANGDSKNSAIKQVASGRFGVTSDYLVNAKELQIKMAQGAKPGEGGQLPGHKVYPWIAKVRLLARRAWA